MITVGIDEVGRGCWAGPLVAGAVILPSQLDIEDKAVKLRDSKKLSRTQREATNYWIQEHALAIGLGWVSPTEIDEMGISESVRLAMQRALTGILIEYDEVIVDGNINYFTDNPKAKAVIKADDSVLSVSAASIAAKVARDDYMANLGDAYEGYGFANHVGYGTAAHIAALKQLGVCDLHRRSYKPIRVLLAS